MKMIFEEGSQMTQPDSFYKKLWLSSDFEESNPALFAAFPNHGS